MARRKRFKLEIADILGRRSKGDLGNYSTSDDLILLTSPYSLEQVPEEFVVAHESLHRLLIWGTLFGFFERLIVEANDQAEKTGTRIFQCSLEQIISKGVDDTFITHEAVACYLELCCCAQDHGDVEEYRKTFSYEQAAALDQLINVLELPNLNSLLLPYQWTSAVLMAKVALNGPILKEFADTAKLNEASFELFESTESPDLRFQRLCAAIKEKGGLRFLLLPFTEVFAIAWKRVFASPAPFCDFSGGYRLLDLRSIGGLNSKNGHLVAEYAEHELMRFLASCAPELEVFIGPEEMELIATPFLTKWKTMITDSKEKETTSDTQLIITPIGDERKFSRYRRYMVRYKLKDPRHSVTLNQLREYLTSEAKKRRMTFAGFLETVSGEAAIFAASFDGFDRVNNRVAATNMVLRQSIIGTMSVLEILDFALLAHNREPYAENTAWHLPLELAHKLGFPNLAVGIHGALLRSWPSCYPQVIGEIARTTVKEGKEVYVRTINLTERRDSKMLLDWDLKITARIIDHESKTIVLQSFDDSLPWFRRLPCSPSFTSWLGTAKDVSAVESELAGDPQVRWGDPQDRAETSLLTALLNIAYNLDSYMGYVFEGALLPVENPIE